MSNQDNQTSGQRDNRTLEERFAAGCEKCGKAATCAPKQPDGTFAVRCDACYWDDASPRSSSGECSPSLGYIGGGQLGYIALLPVPIEPTWTVWDFLAIAVWLVALYFACGRVFRWSKRVKVRLLWVARNLPMQVDCAWCGVTLRPGRQPVSHGICPQCKEALIEGGAPMPERLSHN